MHAYKKTNNYTNTCKETVTVQTHTGNAHIWDIVLNIFTKDIRIDDEAERLNKFSRERETEWNCSNQTNENWGVRDDHPAVWGSCARFSKTTPWLIGQGPFACKQNFSHNLSTASHVVLIHSGLLCCCITSITLIQVVLISQGIEEMGRESEMKQWVVKQKSYEWSQERGKEPDQSSACWWCGWYTLL